MTRNFKAVSSRNALLLAVLVLALFLRLRGIGFGLPALYDADEPLFALAALKLLRNQTFNPGWFGHPGTTTIYALALVDGAVFLIGLVTGRFADVDAFGRAIYADPGILMLPGRLFILFCGLLSIALTGLLGRRLFGPVTGLTAAMLLAVDPVHIRYSQIIRTDMHATIFVLLCVLGSIGIARRGRLRDFAWASLWLGLACATKWPAVCVGIAIPGAVLHRAFAQPQERAQLVRRLALTPVLTGAALLAASPFLLIDYPTLLVNLQGEARLHHPGATGHGFLGNLAWYVSSPLHHALGPVGVVLAAIGFVIAACVNKAFRATIVPVTILFLVAISVQALIWERWVVPILPFASIAAAFAIVTCVRRLPKPIFAAWWRKAAGGGVLIVVAIAPALVGLEADARERARDTRALATAWAIEHIPSERSVIVEALAFDMLGHGWRFLYPVGDAGCVDVAAALHAKVPYSTVERWRGNRAIIDLGTIDPAKFGTCRADFAVIAGYDRFSLEPETYAGELAIYRRLIAQGRIVATFRPIPGKVGGPIVRIVQLDPNRAGWN